MRSPAMEQFRQRVIASYHLGPLDEEETRGYIEHRLHRVAWKGDPAFDPTAIHSIYQATGGIPRRINAVCNRLMLAGFLANQHNFTSVEVDSVAAEISSELGPQAGGPPARDSLAVRSDRHPDLVGNVRRLIDIADRVENLEANVGELLRLVRVLVEP